MLNIEDKPAFDNRIALFRLGFRPFFLGASAFAAAAMLYWMGVVAFALPFTLPAIDAVAWHAHEMLFGYAAAVIAGFLLTAVMNWTGRQTLRGAPLALLFLLWLSARLLPFAGAALPLGLYALVDGGFLLLLFLAVLQPVIKSRQWGQLGIVAKVLLLFCADVVFYLGVFGVLDNGVPLGLYSALYFILALILVLARRVFPFFIEKGVGYPVTLHNRRWLDNTSLGLFTLLWLTDVVLDDRSASAILSLALFVLHGIRLRDWHTPGIWRKPLLWVLYLAYLWIILGFALKAAEPLGIPAALAVHAWTVGGIGMVTIGMMARVGLAHTGRNVFEPPPLLRGMFLLMLAASIVRVLGPLLGDGAYLLTIGLAQLLWIAAFGLFFQLYFPLLLRQRVDGRDG